MTLPALLDQFDLLMDTPQSVPKLRQFILQSAVQGRLTEQHPDDELAELLLDRIHSEKQRLYDAGEIRKPKNLKPVSTAENPFQLPESWEWTRFGTACNIVRGITFSKSDKFEQKKDGRVACLRTANVQEEVVWDDLIFVDSEFVKREEQWLHPGDTLISMSNSYELVGKVAFANRVPQKTTIGGFLGIVRPYCCFDEEYMYYALNSPLMQQGMRQTSSQTTNIANLALRDIRPLPFPLPPLEEQQRVVETVDGLMDECDALEQQQERKRTLQVQVGTAATEALQSADSAEALRPAWERVREHFDTVTATVEGVDALRQTILQLAVQGHLTERDPDDTPADVLLEEIQQEKQRLYDAGEIRKPKNLKPVSTAENPFQLPESWEWTRFGTACNIVRGITFSKSDKFEQKKDGRVACLRTANVQEEVVWDDLIFVDSEFVKREEQWLHPGDTLISMSNSYELVGKVALTKKVPQKTTIGGFLGIVRPYCCFDEEYMYYALNSPLMQQGMRETSSQTTNIANLALRDIRPLPFPLPPLQEQRRIVDAIDHLLPLCDRLHDHLGDLNRRGEKLLETALRGASVSQRDAMPAEAAA